MDPQRLYDAADRNEEVARRYDIGSEDIERDTRLLDQRLLGLCARWNGMAQSRFYELWDAHKQETLRHCDSLRSIAAALCRLADLLRIRAHEELERRREAEAERWRRERELEQDALIL